MHLAGFRYDTGASDTNWMCCTKDGTTLTATDSGVAVAADTPYDFLLVCGTSNVLFYINDFDTPVATITTTLPGTSQAIGHVLRLTTLVAANRAMRFARFWVRHR